MFAKFRNGFQRLLEAIVIILMSSLTVIVLVAVAYRKGGASLSWYDEIASILLAWLTYYGAALAAINRGHIGFAGLIKAMKPGLRMPFIIFSEISGDPCLISCSISSNACASSKVIKFVSDLTILVVALFPKKYAVALLK